MDKADSSGNSTKMAFKKFVAKYFKMMTQGCGRTACDNKDCISNPDVVKYSPSEAGQKALQLAYQAAVLPEAPVLCIDSAVPFTDEKEMMEMIEGAKQTSSFDVLRKKVKDVFGNPHSLNLSFVTESTSSESSGVDLEAVERIFGALLSSGMSKASEYLTMCLEEAAAQLKTLRQSRFFNYAKGLRLFDVILSFPLLMEPNTHRHLLLPVTAALVVLSDQSRGILMGWWSRLGSARLHARLAIFHQLVTMRILLPPPIELLNNDEAVVMGTKALQLLHDANQRAPKPPPIHFKSFYNESINEMLDIREDFILFIQESGFSFCSVPVVLDPLNKSRLLKLESRVSQVRQMDAAYRQALFGVPSVSPYLIFAVRRDHLIQDTLAMIVRQEDGLKKQLKVVFEGEEGIDEGGVQKEFFQLIVREIFNPDFGMFRLHPDTRNYWFSPFSQELREFELIGVILGLAIYNTVILDVRFPLVVYKKLLGEEPTLDDLKEVFPDTYNGIRQLLEFEGDVEAVFARDFTVSYEYYGGHQTFELKPGGADIMLTNNNKEEYVRLFVEHKLSKSIEKQFEAFRKGFSKVVAGATFGMFTPEELELLICGDAVLDFEELEKATQYDNGFDKDHQVIKWFWEVVHSLSEEQRKKLLFFCHGL